MSEPTKTERQSLLVPLENGQSIGSLTLNEIQSQGRNFSLRQPLQIDISTSAEGWYCESRPLAILAFGRSKREALDSFMEDFSVLWEEIAQASDDSLTIEAVSVKRAFQQLVRTATAE